MKDDTCGNSPTFIPNSSFLRERAEKTVLESRDVSRLLKQYLLALVDRTKLLYSDSDWFTSCVCIKACFILFF